MLTSSKNVIQAKRRWHMRCSRGRQGCGMRFVLAKQPWFYVRTPKCPYCKSAVIVDCEEEHRAKLKMRKEKNLTCYCNKYWHPHLPGNSFPMCIQSKVTPTDEDVAEHESRSLAAMG